MRSGECLLVGGPSGSGKSTLLGVIAGLLPAWGGRLTGEVTVAGKAVDELSVEDRAGLIGFFQQAPAGQFLHETVRKDCAFALENAGWEPDRVRLSVDSALSRFGVAHLAERNPHELSGGEQALVLLASLWTLRPQILLLDEPLANLDHAHAETLRDALVEWKREGCTLVICEHREDLLGSLADRRIEVQNGAVVEKAAGPVAGFTVEPPLSSVQQSAPPCVGLFGLAVSRGGRRLFAGLTASWRPGELVVLRGPNGAGKSSLLRVLAGLDRPESGVVSVLGQPRLVGQDPLDQLCRSTLGQECLLDLEARRRRLGSVSLVLDRDDLTRVLTTAGLADQTQRSPFVLSEGGKRRLTAACGLLSGAQVLLLDEPTSGLDPESSAAIASLVLAFVRRGGLVVCATHDERWAQIPGARMVDLAPFQTPAPRDHIQAFAPPLAPFPRDPRWRFGAFLAALAWAAFPWPWPIALGAFVAVVLSYLPRKIRPLAAFLKTLALFWVVPGVLLLVLVGPGAALEGVLRLGLLSLLFHRFFFGVDGKALAAALAKWGIPYTASFALSAATAQVPVWRHRINAIHEMLTLRLARKSRLPSLRALSLLLVPTVVQVWQHAAQLAMNLDLRGFQGKPGIPPSPSRAADTLDIPRNPARSPGE